MIKIFSLAYLKIGSFIGFSFSIFIIHLDILFVSKLKIQIAILKGVLVIVLVITKTATVVTMTIIPYGNSQDVTRWFTMNKVIDKAITTLL